MAGKNLQVRMKNDYNKNKQSRITSFFSKPTEEKNNQDIPFNQEINSTEQNEVKIISSYFSPPKDKNSSKSPLKRLSKRRLSLRKSKDPPAKVELKCEKSNLEPIKNKDVLVIDGEKEKNSNLKNGTENSVHKEITPKRKRLSLSRNISLNNDSKDFSQNTNEDEPRNEPSVNFDISVRSNASKTSIAVPDDIASTPEPPDSLVSCKNISVIDSDLSIPSSSKDGIQLPKKRKTFSDVPYEEDVKKKENPSNLSKSLNVSNETSPNLVAMSEDGEVDENKDGTFYVPYYLENFKIILSQVMEDEAYYCLFDEVDQDTIKTFNSLSEPSQKLYVRLFARKLTWRMQSKLKYPQIAEDLSGYLEELIQAGFGLSEEHLNDLPEVVALLPVTELKTVAKSFHYNCINLTKPQIVELLINHCKKVTTSSILFGINGEKQAEKAMINRSKKLLGRCFKLVESVRTIFLRFLVLFSLANTTIDEDVAQSISQKLFQMLQVNIGTIVFPKYTINKRCKIFRKREDFINYTQVILMESELFSKMEKKEWSAAYDIYVQAKKIYDENTKDPDLIKWDQNLPLFLRHCTSGYVFARILFQGVELLQRKKDYKQACQVLQDLLSQDVYAPLHRGRWYERLSLNFVQHLKLTAKALDVIEKALEDPWVAPHYRLSLFLRAEKIGKASNPKWHKKFAKMEQISFQKSPEVFITGKTLHHSLPGIKYQFMTEQSDEGVTLCNVEQLVLNHYKENGYPKGIHAEGSIVSTLFFLFFWEIIFMDVPDVFRCPFQTYPLDMMSSEFYGHRKNALDDRLQHISTASIQELWDMIAHTWSSYFGVTCGINWDKWASVEEIQGLVSCMGGAVLSGILGRYAKNPRHTRSGFPDLTLWNVETKKFKISEVKGPGDRLSTKQMLWIDHLLHLGVDAEVCHIKPVGAKKLTNE